MTDTIKHVSFVMDGNRRARGEFGHEDGYQALLNLLPQLLRLEIPCLSFYALSLKNLEERSAEEIAHLFNIFRRGIPQLCSLPEIQQHDVKFRAIGEWRARMPRDLWYTVEELEWKTRERKGPIFALGLVYDFWSEILAMAERVQLELPWPRKAKLTQEDVRKRTWTGELPDTSIIIRTGEEYAKWSHGSGFLNCISGNAWTRSTPVFWPDFTIELFQKILGEFEKIKQRRGA